MVKISLLASKLNLEPIEVRRAMRELGIGKPSDTELSEEDAIRVEEFFRPQQPPASSSGGLVSGTETGLQCEESDRVRQEAAESEIERISLKVAALEGALQAKEELQIEEVRRAAYTAALGNERLLRLGRKLSHLNRKYSAFSRQDRVDANLTALGLPTSQQLYSRAISGAEKAVEIAKAQQDLHEQEIENLGK